MLQLSLLYYTKLCGNVSVLGIEQGYYTLGSMYLLFTPCFQGIYCYISIDSFSSYLTSCITIYQILILNLNQLNQLNYQNYIILSMYVINLNLVWGMGYIDISQGVPGFWVSKLFPLQFYSFFG